MTEYEKMRNGEIYLYPDDPEFIRMRDEKRRYLRMYNNADPCDEKTRVDMLKKMFASVGEGCCIEPSMNANLGGMFVHFGKNVYANFGFTLVDDAPIYVDDGTMFGPNVTITTAGHPVNPVLRAAGYLYCEPVHIGKNCWIGADVSILPGVTIGDNVVIGAGSVVTRDIPANMVAYGSPCKPVREVSDRDKEYYFRDKKIPEELKEKYNL